jgi:hypothetical protein
MTEIGVPISPAELAALMSSPDRPLSAEERAQVAVNRGNSMRALMEEAVENTIKQHLSIDVRAHEVKGKPNGALELRLKYKDQTIGNPFRIDTFAETGRNAGRLYIKKTHLEVT